MASSVSPIFLYFQKIERFFENNRTNEIAPSNSFARVVTFIQFTYRW
jgi:hypothetical protein